MGIKAKFYIDFNYAVERVCVSCKYDAVEYFADIEDRIEEALECIDSPTINLEKDNWYKVKMKKRYEDDGSGMKRFSGFEIQEIKCCTLIYCSTL